MIELLAPAGDFEKLTVAIEYGADAVYIGGQDYGLRAMAKNFAVDEMAMAIDYAHERAVKIYVTANIFAHDDDMDGMREYLAALREIGADAVIVSDPGVFALARETVPDMELHISTQANITNSHGARFWHELGAERIILARELSLTEIGRIRDQNPELALEAFVHGAMCVSYSGRCLLSNYLTGRDANRGACAHPCRYKYSLMEETRKGIYLPIEEDSRGSYIMNAKDLCMIEYLPELIAAGVASFKIEGRMKSAHYVASATKAYREALDDYAADPEMYERRKSEYLEELRKAGCRDFYTGFYFGKPGIEAQTYDQAGTAAGSVYLGIVRSYEPETGLASIEQRNKFSLGDSVEILTPNGKGFAQRVETLLNDANEPIESAPHPQQLVWMKMESPVRPFDMLRK